VKSRGALLWEPGTGSGWSVEDIEVHPPKEGEVLIKLAAAGLCHSDDHIDTGDVAIDFAPFLGGHEGAGVIQEVGPGVRDLAEGDHCVLAFIPACGHCHWCFDGRSNLCDMGEFVMSGFWPDGTKRISARGEGVGAISMLGTFSQYIVAPAASVVKIDDDIPLRAATLVGCGVPTGYGSAVHIAETKPSDVVVVVGIGGVGINAVQGARIAGAEKIVAVDPVAFKREKALELGATHVAASVEEAFDLVGELTRGRMADKAIITVGIGDPALIEGVVQLVSKGGIVVHTSAAPMTVTSVDLGLFAFAMFEKQIRGTVFGGCNPHNDIPKLLDLYRAGTLKLDELATNTYRLDDINQGYADMREGRSLRGLILYDD
jgi:NDMA-dependent alcohol dehydrogenase